MAIKTDYQDFVLKEGRNREFDIVQNPNLSTSLIERDDAYETIGDYTGAGVLNELGARAMYLFTQTVSGSIVSFDTEDMIKENTTINGSVLIATAIPSGATFKVNGVTVPAYMGDELVSELPVGKWASFIFDGTQLNFKGGSGGGLNYAVITVANEADLPPTAKENTIAVITDNSFGNYTFSKDAPTSPSTNDLWIKTNDVIKNFAFNVFKKNALITYPTGATQWNGSAWETNTAFIYQAGEWKTFEQYVYLYPVEYITGIKSYITTDTNTGTYRTIGATDNGCLSYQIDFTGIKTITLVRGAVTNDNFCWLAVSDETDGVMVYNRKLAYTSMPTTNTAGTVTLDVSAITGVHYINLAVSVSSLEIATLSYTY